MFSDISDSGTSYDINSIYQNLTILTTSINDINISLRLNETNLNDWNPVCGINAYSSDFAIRCNENNLTTFNCSDSEYVKFEMGQKSLDFVWLLLVTPLYLLVFIAGIIGNVIVCVVIVRHASMHTATNYYLFSLAVSDLLYLLSGLPFDLSIYWEQYPYRLPLAVCKMRALISEASSYVSVLTIVAFSMERFLAICHPLHLYAMSGFKRAIRIIAVLWIVSFICAVPFGMYSTIQHKTYPCDNHIIYESAFCAMMSIPSGFPLWELSTMIFFVIPMVVLIVLYGRMGFKIRSRSRHSYALGVQQGSMHGESRQSQSRKAIIRMLAAVVITFFICWAPFHAQRISYLYTVNYSLYVALNNWLFPVAGLLYYISCTINPILYNVMSRRYRTAFRETLCGKSETRNQMANGFSREQSSFRDAITGSYNATNMGRIRSIRQSKYNRERVTNSTTNWKEKPLLDDEKQKKKIEFNQLNAQQKNPTDLVVVIGNKIHERPICYTTSSSSGTTTTSPIMIKSMNIINGSTEPSDPLLIENNGHNNEPRINDTSI